MKILLVYPQNPNTFWSFKHVLRFVSKRSAFPPLGLLTVAAMLPVEWELRLVDLNVEPLTDDNLHWADHVMISAMLVHRESVNKVVGRCKQLGKTIIAGGPLFTTGHEAFPDIQHFVLGEAEDLMPQLVADMTRGVLQHFYQSSKRPEITTVPVPRWDLINSRHYVTMSVQFSRGCPFNCEFCDIIIMNGRVPRTKTSAQLVAELEALRLLGWKDMVFIVDDNFIGDRKRTKALLHAIIEWRAQTQTKMGFLTEASMNLADDPELCDLMGRAGFKKVFVGIETPSPESLEECQKVQNKSRDMVKSVQIIQSAGMEVMGGFIVGFDQDKMDIFHQQFEFIQRSGVATAMVGLLTALPQTRLYQRLMREGRIETTSSGNNTSAALNFKPKLNRDFLLSGYRQLMESLYEPRTYYKRIKVFLEHYRPRRSVLRLAPSDFKALMKSFWLLGVWHRGRTAYWWFMLTTLICRPRLFGHAMELAIMGYHFRRIAQDL